MRSPALGARALPAALADALHRTHRARSIRGRPRSGYGYHRSESAPVAFDRIWLEAPMWSDSAAFDVLGDKMPWPHIRFATTVADVAAHGPLRGQLHWSEY
mmetsp:Transcript_45562/g.126409  ORF Transcript_45562/g.126409 Transcript_45562/m.126409 type:complete len:101 (+) Transcript_45562:1150-1452(+)|eukprot:3868382-Prymnesium_polylepis.1